MAARRPRRRWRLVVTRDVTDVHETLDFYRGFGGAEIVREGEGSAVLRLGDAYCPKDHREPKRPVHCGRGRVIGASR